MKNVPKVFTAVLIFTLSLASFVEGREAKQPKIHFDPRHKQIQESSYPTLNEVISILKSHPEVKKVRIEGHTDSHEKRGSKALLKLSEERAQTVKDYLIQHGIQAHRLEIIGYADERPIQSNQTEEGRAANRRVEFNVLDQGPANTSQSSSPQKDNP